MSLPSHPEADHSGGPDTEPAPGDGSRRLRLLGITAAIALVVLVVVLHLTGVVGGGH